MTKQELETTWIPRIGETATNELYRFRKIAIYGTASPIFAVAAGLLIGTSALGDVIGAVSTAAVVAYVVMFIRGQMRIAAALSEWYGVKIRGIPKMNPKRFDTWAQARGLQRPDEQIAIDQAARVSDTPQGGHGSSSSSMA
jgi:hypothetical protein